MKVGDEVIVISDYHNKNYTGLGSVGVIAKIYDSTFMCNWITMTGKQAKFCSKHRNWSLSQELVVPLNNSLIRTLYGL